ncbi:hypothetical protein PENPOL_c004G02183 [Penicillium polonicum]|uniref:Uncharacterized protein n=1 Tax=Penicillium polonicum TaxID=60169 RepID=A0A1V6NPK2_PENPO|nr:hypothetical protein PENPOL_c004G02183 [Penicillium polonicum]
MEPRRVALLSLSPAELDCACAWIEEAKLLGGLRQTGESPK